VVRPRAQPRCGSVLPGLVGSVHHLAVGPQYLVKPEGGIGLRYQPPVFDRGESPWWKQAPRRASRLFHRRVVHGGDAWSHGVARVRICDGRQYVKSLRLTKPVHRRAWWRLWLYCRCGRRWICPDSILLVPRAYRPSSPPVYRNCWSNPRNVLIPLTEEEAGEVRALSDAPPPSRPRPRNQRPEWGQPTHSHLEGGRPGALTPARQHRSRSGARV
jgi:hypothetical protein